MASPNKTGSTKYEIVARRDGYCVLCRGRTLKGGRVWWDQGNGTVHHVECPPVVEIAGDAYAAPPVTPDRWKQFCQQIQAAMSGKSTVRAVTEEDRQTTDGEVGIVRNVIARTRCTGAEAIEIVRRWIDSLKAPVDEEKFQRVNRALSESRQPALSMVAEVREPGMEG